MEVNGEGGKLDCIPLWTGGRGGAKLQVYYCTVVRTKNIVKIHHFTNFGVLDQGTCIFSQMVDETSDDNLSGLLNGDSSLQIEIDCN